MTQVLVVECTALTHVQYEQTHDFLVLPANETSVAHLFEIMLSIERDLRAEQPDKDFGTAACVAWIADLPEAVVQRLDHCCSLSQTRPNTSSDAVFTFDDDVSLRRVIDLIITAAGRQAALFRSKPLDPKAAFLMLRRPLQGGQARRRNISGCSRLNPFRRVVSGRTGGCMLL